jgi:DinB superfamily
MQYMKLNNTERNELLSSLQDMPRFLAKMFAEIDDEQARHVVPDHGFSPVEQVWHLADLENEGFGERIHRLLTEQQPELPDFDGDRVAREREYKTRSFTQGLQAFQRAREKNIAALNAIRDDQWLRNGTQEGVGEVSLCDMPVFIHQHDVSHIKEIQEWMLKFNPVPPNHSS